MSLTVALGRGAQEGILTQDAQALELLARVDTLAFDKTGTLTAGRLTVTDVVPLGTWQPTDLLRHAASVEAASEHPLAAAVVIAAQTQGLT